MKSIPYDFTAEIWQTSGKGGWYFVSLPANTSKEIRSLLQWQEEGWGRMKAQATLCETSWDTAIWYDKKKETYLLPIKAAIRKRLHLEVGQEYEVMILV